jgi:dynein light chain LC8-type
MTTAAGTEAQKAIIKSADMSEEVQASAIEVARTALRTFETERDIAKHIKVRALLRTQALPN